MFFRVHVGLLFHYQNKVIPDLRDDGSPGTQDEKIKAGDRSVVEGFTLEVWCTLGLSWTTAFPLIRKLHRLLNLPPGEKNGKTIVSCPHSASHGCHETEARPPIIIMGYHGQRRTMHTYSSAVHEIGCCSIWRPHAWQTASKWTSSSADFREVLILPSWK